MVVFTPKDCFTVREFISGGERWRHIAAKAKMEDGSVWIASSNFPEEAWETAHEHLAKCAKMLTPAAQEISKRARAAAEMLCFNSSYPGSSRSTVGMKPMRSY